MEGGHSVPIEKIVSRYARAMANLEPFIGLCDRAYVFDNSADEQDARLVARYRDAALRKTYGPQPRWLAQTTVAIPKHPDFEESR
jgi:predicted ABC-type ATPase